MIRGKTLNNNRDIKIEIPGRIHNRFDVEVRDIRTGKVKQKAVGYNLLTDYFWIQFETGNWFNYIHYGTGTTEPAAADVMLASHLGYGQLGSSTWTLDVDNGFVSLRKQYTILSGTHTGAVLSEIGLSYSTYTTNYLSTHALLKDMNGNPITITIGEYDEITLYATVFAKLDFANGYLNGALRLTPAKSISFYKWLLGDSRSTDRAFYVSGSYIPTPLKLYSQYVSSSSNYLEGEGGTVSDHAEATWDVLNKKITVTYPRVQPDKGNPAADIGIRSVTLESCGTTSTSNAYTGTWAVLNFPNSLIPYTEITGESIGTGDGALSDFKTKFGVINDDDSIQVYVDGVLQTEGTDYTVDFNKPSNNIIDTWFKPLDYNSKFDVLIDNDNYAMEGIKGITLNVGKVVTAFTEVYENPYYLSYGVSSFIYDKDISETPVVSTSNDLETWTSIPLSSGTVSVPAGQQNARYWKFDRPAESSSYDGVTLYNFICDTLDSDELMDIHFISPPALDSEITIDYRTECLAKDSNHVFDLEIELTFAEGT